MNNTDNLKIKRINIQGLISEYILSSSTAVILLDGLPSIPKRKEELKVLAQKGFSVFFPRYKGCWESEGYFLESLPSKDIDNFITNLIEGISLDNKIHKFSKVYVISSSFGGYVSLNLNLDNVQKVIALSPVVDFTQIYNIGTLESHLKQYYPGAYRFNSENWHKLIKNEYTNFSTLISNNKKVTIFSGKQDDEVKFKDLEIFSKKYTIKLLSLDDFGHMSFSTLLESNILKLIVEYIEVD